MMRRPRRAPKARTDGGGPTAHEAPLNSPFADLGKRLRLRPPPPPPPPPAPRPAVEAKNDGPDLFERAMEGVRRLPRGGGHRVDGPMPASRPRPRVSEEAEALAELSDLVHGETSFDVSDTREYIEGAIVGLDPRVLRRLRRGDFAWQAHVDLHGMTADQARAAVLAFLQASVRAGYRCVLVVHGRGLNSKDQTPVLKERMKSWLARGTAARIVLAFATARPCDGGAGALYVLLRRDRSRQPIRVTEGAKR
jgi:DNA-nicking Smr family endonuclease